MDSNNKKRTTNFSEKEVTILISLVRKYRDKVECRKSDKNTNKIKLEAWTQICKEFNCTSGELYRNWKVLKNKYENIKKQKFIDEKSYINGTGGGPLRMIEISDIDQEIKELIGTQITGSTSHFDSDIKHFTEGDTIPRSNRVKGVEFLVIEDESDSQDIEFPEVGDNLIHQDSTTVDDQVSNETEFSNTVDKEGMLLTEPIEDVTPKKYGNWKKYTPDMLRTPKSSTLKKPKMNQQNYTNNAKRNFAEWAAAKTQTVSQDIEFKKEEHEIMMHCLREEYELKLQLMRECHAHKLMNMEKETNAKIALMKE